MASISGKRKSLVVPTPNLMKVHLRHLEKPKEDDFCLELPISTSNISYNDVTEGVASHLGVDDSAKIRLTYHICDPPQPRSEPIMYKAAMETPNSNQTCMILHYEVLETPLPELQGLKTLNVTFRHGRMDEVSIRSITLPVHSSVGDLINHLITKVERSHPNAELRLLGVNHGEIKKVYPLSEKIENLSNQFWTLHAEEILEEEKSLGPLDYLIHFHHYVKGIIPDPTDQVSQALWYQQHPRSSYEPFVLRINEGESLPEVKVRIQKKLQVPDDELYKWKFYSCPSFRRDGYLQDSDIVSSRFQENGERIRLEHSDFDQRRAGAANQKRLKTENEHVKNEQVLVHLNNVVKVSRSGCTKDQQPMEETEAFIAAPTFDKMTPSPEYPGAGQLYEEGRHGQGAVGETFEDIGGFSVQKTHASFYRQIWLKYGHIASSQVLTNSSYSAQVTVVTDIMKSLLDMHQRHLGCVTHLMIDWWENKIKMAEQLKFNIKWLREGFEDIKKDFNERQKLRTSFHEQYKLSEAATTQVTAAKEKLTKAKEELTKAKEELTKAKKNSSAIISKLLPLHSENSKFGIEKGIHELFPGLFL